MPSDRSVQAGSLCHFAGTDRELSIGTNLNIGHYQLRDGIELFRRDVFTPPLAAGQTQLFGQHTVVSGMASKVA
jgi:hypothetical protein